VTSPRELTNDLLGVWRSHQLADESLRGPFFSPEYIQHVASERPDVAVAIVETPGQPPAFLPFHRDRSNVARPVGLRANDFSGIIASPGCAWSPAAVIRECGLAGWDFTNVVTSQQPMQPYFQSFAESPYTDLRGSVEAFAQHRGRPGSDLVKSIAQKTRKLEREVAPIRFEVHISDRHVLALLYQWKGAQRERTGTFDVLSLPWMRQTLERILDTSTPTFAGLLSVLYAGDRIAAIHLGMRSDTVWHYWFAAYNRELQQYSPGLIILLEMIRSAPTIGIQTLTLGVGDEPYKLRFATGSTRLASGSVDCRLTRRLTNAIWYAARRASRRSRVVAALAHSVKRGRRALSARPASPAARFEESDPSAVGRRTSRRDERGGT
jgi:CelD/BcsL family acetyltransferase involved in cellulose biosynthesis